MAEPLHLPPFLAFSPPSPPLVYYRKETCSIPSLNLGTVTISVRLSNCECFLPSSHCPDTPVIYTFLSSCPIRHRRWQAGCIIPSTLIRSPLTYQPTSSTTEFTVPPVPHHLPSPPLPLPISHPWQKKFGGGYCQSSVRPLAHTQAYSARTAGTPAHKQMHTARVPDPGLLSVPSPPPSPSRAEGRVQGPTWHRS